MSDIWKLQRPLGASVPLEEIPMMMYNSDRSQMAHVHPGTESHDIMTQLFTDEEWDLGKIYFRGSLAEDGVITIEEKLDYPSDPRTHF